MKRIISALFACAVAFCATLPATALPASGIPTKFPLAFGADAGSSYIRQIPTASQINITPGAASLTDGFPPLTFTPVEAGGVPPFGQDMNGILNQVSAWARWQSAGGPIFYDSGFSSSIGGYPKGAILESATNFGSFWISKVDNNTSDPDTGGAGWQIYVPIDLYGTDSGTANAATITLPVTPVSLATLVGVPIAIKKASATNTGSFTIKIGSFSAVGVVHPDGTAIGAGELPGSGILTVIYDGSLFELTNVGFRPAPLASPNLTGNPTAPTQSPGDNTTKLATDAFVTAAISALPAISNATTSVAGIVQLATSSQAIAGTNGTNAVVPTGLTAALANIASAGNTSHSLASVIGSITNGDFATFDGTSGSIEDGGTPGTAAFADATSSNTSLPVISLSGSAVTNDVLIFNSSAGTATDSGVLISALAPLASPPLTGNPTAPTQISSNNSTRIATTAYTTTAISNLNLGTASTQNSGYFLQTSNNLSDVPSDSTARSNLGLGSAAVANASGSTSHPVATALGSFTDGDIITADGTSGSIQDSGMAAPQFCQTVHAIPTSGEIGPFSCAITSSQYPIFSVQLLCNSGSCEGGYSSGDVASMSFSGNSANPTGITVAGNLGDYYAVVGNSVLQLPSKSSGGNVTLASSGGTYSNWKVILTVRSVP